MADNRLFLGNSETGEWIRLSKSGVGKNYGWYDFNIDDFIRDFIDKDRGQFLGYKSDLKFFTEEDQDEWDRELEIKRQ